MLYAETCLPILQGKYEKDPVPGFKKFIVALSDGGEIGGSGVHFPPMPVKYLADLRSRVNSQQYSSIYEDRRPRIEDIERSDGKKSA